jgi:hypothetical protein
MSRRCDTAVSTDVNRREGPLKVWVARPMSAARGPSRGERTGGADARTCHPGGSGPGGRAGPCVRRGCGGTAQPGHVSGLEYTFLVFLIPLLAAGLLALVALRTYPAMWPRPSNLSRPSTRPSAGHDAC